MTKFLKSLLFIPSPVFRKNLSILIFFINHLLNEINDTLYVFAEPIVIRNNRWRDRAYRILLIILFRHLIVKICFDVPNTTQS